MTEFSQRLHQGIAQLNLEISAEKIAQLLAYHALLVKWNKAYNLTAVRDPMEMIDRHLIDSLPMLAYIDRDNIIDVGTGGGLPGMIIAICRPDVSVTLLDSNGKKTRFLQQVKMELKLPNVTVVHSRLEEYFPERKFDLVTSRAFASLEDMVNWSHQLLADKGRYLAMKGLHPVDEVAALPSLAKLDKSIKLSVPFTQGERHLLVLSHNH